jgi:hypothetical protein
MIVPPGNKQTGSAKSASLYSVYIKSCLKSNIAEKSTFDACPAFPPDAQTAYIYHVISGFSTKFARCHARANRQTVIEFFKR